jgi:hypothetical protein
MRILNSSAAAQFVTARIWLVCTSLVFAILGAGPCFAGTFNPTDHTTQLQLWLDPNDASTLTLSSEGKVLAWRDKSPLGLVFTSDPAHAPQFVANAFTKSAGVHFQAGQYLTATDWSWNNSPRGEILGVFQSNQFTVEDFLFSTSSAQYETRYAIVMTRNGEPALRMRDSVAVPAFNGSINGAGLPPTQAGTEYVMNIRGFGAGGLASHEIRLNEQQGNVLPSYQVNAAMQNLWFDDIGARNRVTLSGLVTASRVQTNQDMTLGPLYVLGDNLTAEENLAAETWMRSYVTQPVPEPSYWLAIMIPAALWLVFAGRAKTRRTCLLPVRKQGLPRAAR